MQDLLAVYRASVRARRLDERLSSLAHAGRIGAHPDARGFEPSLAAVVLALRPDDAVFPGLREHAAALVRGLPIADYVAHAFGTAEGPTHGHGAPAMLASRALRVGPPSGLLSNHLTHAAGHAWAGKLRRDDVVTLALFGEAAADAGEFHTAVNFAGATRAPIVFVCRTDRTGASGLPRPVERVIDKAVAYGVEAAEAPAHDVASVHAALTRALARARSGEGPTLLEIVRTDPACPIESLRDALIAAGVWDSTQDFALHRDTTLEIEAAVRAAMAAAPPARASLFEHVFAALGPQLEAQQRALLDAPSGAPVAARRENES